MRMGNLLKGFLSALGLTGSLVVTGYIIESAYQRFLGTTTGFLGTTAYVASASEFLLDLSLLFTHAGPARTAQILIVAGGMLLAGWGIRQRQARIQRLIGPRRRLLMLVVSAMALLNFWWYVLPAATEENVLSSNLQSPSGIAREKTRLGIPSRDLWLTTVCAHMPTTPAGDSSSTDYKALVTTCQDFAHIKTAPFQGYYVEQLNRHLVQNALNVCWLAAFGLLVSIASAHFVVRTMDWETVLAVGLLAVNLAGIPFQYGKTVRLKPVAFAAVYLMPELKQIPQLGGYKSGLVLYETDSGYTFVEATARKIWFVPRANVAVIEVEDDKDVLEYFIDETVAKAGP
jgi:hypothetical protein